MPAPEFRDDLAFGLELPGQTDQQPQRVKKKPGPPPGTKIVRQPETRAADHVIGPSTRDTLIDRLEAAMDAGVIDLLGDDRPVSEVSLTRAEMELLLSILVPR